MTEKTLVLNKGADQRLRKGHCWIYSNEVNVRVSPLKAFEPGEQVLLSSSSGKMIGTCFVQPNALIAGRLISRNSDQWMDKSLLVHRLKVADSIRQRLFRQPFYRLCFGDSDQLPGLVIDRMNDVFVVQVSTAGMESLKSAILQAIQQIFRATTVIFKNDHKMRSVEGMDSYVELALGDEKSLESVELIENDVRFKVPLLKGQKTGWFFDHRMNRARLKSYVNDKRVLDLFSYVGGWGIQAAAAGAAHVTCVDSSQRAIEGVFENASLNQLSERVEGLAMDAFEACQQLKAERTKFDVVVVDPPAFIARKKDIKAGEAAYHRINQLAMRLLDKDGILVSASCSMHLSQPSLLEVIRSTARATDRQVQVLELGMQSPDHPILPAVPETHYIKAIFTRVLTGH